MTYQAEVLADSPSVYYRMDDTSGTQMTDSSGNARHGTLSGTYTQNATSLLDTDSGNPATTFTNGVGTIAYDAAWLASVSFSVEALFQPSGTLTGVKGICGRYTGTASASRWAIRLNGTSLVLTYFLSGGNTSITIATGLSTGVKHQVAVTYDGTTFRVYVDGHLTYATTATINATSSPFYVGRENASSPFTGIVDEVSYYDGVVLSDLRIAAHYSAIVSADSTGNGVVQAVTVPAGRVASTLTNFVTRLDLSLMAEAWWDDTTHDLGNVRVKQGGSVIPFDITYFDRATRVGELFFRYTLTTSDNPFTVETVNGATAIASSATNGRDDVWQDYGAVMIGGTVDRTGSGLNMTFVASAVMNSDGWLNCGASAGAGHISGVPIYGDHTIAASVIVGTAGANNRSVLTYAQQNSATDSQRVTLAHDNGTRIGYWNSSHDWIYASAAAYVTNGMRIREHGIHNVTGNTRVIYGYQGGAATPTSGANEANATAKPGGSAGSLYIGQDDASATASTRFNGTINYVYLRSGQLSADWIAAENLSWEGGAFAEALGVYVAGEAFSAPATMLDGSVSVDVYIAGEPFAASVTMLDGMVVTVLEVEGEAFSASTTMLDGTPVTENPPLEVAGEAFAGTVVMLDGTALAEDTGDVWDIPPVTIDLSAAAPTMLVSRLTTRKWAFFDPATDEFVYFSINPDSMTSPVRPRTLSHGREVGPNNGRYSTFQSPRAPRPWEFAGVIRTQAQHDFFHDWADKAGIIHVTDHLNRTFEVIIQGLEITERRPTQNVRWRQRYSMKTLLLRQLT